MAIFTGTSANETFEGTESSDTAFGNGGNDWLSGNGGADTLQLGANGTSTASGGAGNDTLNVEGSGQGAKTLLGGEGEDRISIGGAVVGYVIDGGEGIDTLGLFGTNSVDFSRSMLTNVEAFSGGSGDDVVVLGASQFVGFDTFDSGGGADLTKVSFSGAVDLSVAELPDTVGLETLRMIGSSGNDTLTVGIGLFTEAYSFSFGRGADTLNVVTSGDVDLRGVFPRLFHVENVTLVGTGSVQMNVAQFARFSSIGDGLSVTLFDTGAHLKLLTPAEISSLSARGVEGLDAKNDLLYLSVDQFLALGSLDLSASDVVTLSDTGARISDLSISQFETLAQRGFDRIKLIDEALSLTVAQCRALGTVTFTKAGHVTLADTASNLALLTPAEHAALVSKGIDEVKEIGGSIETAMSNYVLDAFADNLKFIGSGPFAGTGNGRANTIMGGTSGDTLNGLGGSDMLIGGTGDDTLIGGLGADVLDGGAGSGDYASYVNATTGVTASLANPSSNTGEAAGDTYISIERLAGSSFNDTLVGDAGANTLRGNAGADVLNGGAGSDYASYTTATMGLTASLSNPGINTGDAAGDTYISIESLAGSNFDDILVGDASDNTFQGNLGADQIDGGAGFDYASYFNATTGVTASLANAAINAGEAAGDTYAQIEGLTGSAFADILVGNGGDNWLLGGGGADKLDGGSGFDTAGYGNSTIALTVSLLDPSANTGEAAGDVYTSIEGVSGSSFNDILIGNAGANTLSGGFGNDSLSGGDGNDQLIGGSGDDFLEGGAGADVFNGGDGTDTVSYYQYSVSGGAGVIASLENASINTGDATGDTYVSVENLAGTFWNDTLIGTSGNNVIDGVNGTDVFNGRGGMDTLIGNGGGDTFVFDSVIGAGNLATISGFVHGQDHFNLDNAIFTQLGAEGALGAGAFVNGAAALDANDRIIFNTATGNVSYDADGSGAGAAVVFATMQNLGVALDHTDFMIV